MILVDTSVWADHIRHSDEDLVQLLITGRLLTHPFIIEELACGHLPDRDEFLAELHALPRAVIASHPEILALISDKKLFGTGLGSVDIHIIASAMLSRAKVWSRDRAMMREASRLGVAVT